MIDKFGALDNNALAGQDSLRDQHALSVKRLDTDGALLKSFG